MLGLSWEMERENEISCGLMDPRSSRKHLHFLMVFYVRKPQLRMIFAVKCDKFRSTVFADIFHSSFRLLLILPNIGIRVSPLFKLSLTHIVKKPGQRRRALIYLNVFLIAAPLLRTSSYITYR